MSAFIRRNARSFLQYSDWASIVVLRLVFENNSLQFNRALVEWKAAVQDCTPRLPMPNNRCVDMVDGVFRLSYDRGCC